MTWPHFLIAFPSVGIIFITSHLFHSRQPSLCWDNGILHGQPHIYFPILCEQMLHIFFLGQQPTSHSSSYTYLLVEAHIVGEQDFFHLEKQTFYLNHQKWTWNLTTAFNPFEALTTSVCCKAAVEPLRVQDPLKDILTLLLWEPGTEPASSVSNDRTTLHTEPPVASICFLLTRQELFPQRPLFDVWLLNRSEFDLACG